jgi:hypothetical protein
MLQATTASPRHIPAAAAAAAQEFSDRNIKRLFSAERERKRAREGEVLQY